MNVWVTESWTRHEMIALIECCIISWLVLIKIIAHGTGYSKLLLIKRFVFTEGLYIRLERVLNVKAKLQSEKWTQIIHYCNVGHTATKGNTAFLPPTIKVKQDLRHSRHHVILFKLWLFSWVEFIDISTTNSTARTIFVIVIDFLAKWLRYDRLYTRCLNDFNRDYRWKLKIIWV